MARSDVAHFAHLMRKNRRSREDLVKPILGENTFWGMSLDPCTLDLRLANQDFNTWRGFAVKPTTSGSWALLREHILVNICDGREQVFEYVMAWFAHLVQRPEIKPGVAFVLYGNNMGRARTC